MAKKILVITGSPRGNGNTNALVNKVIEGVESAGGKVEVVDATELDCTVPGCLACGGCQPDNLRCVLEDDVSDLVADFPKYDIIVFATPIYFFSFPAQLKIVIDRMQSLLLHESGMIFSPLKRVQFVVVATGGGTEDDSGFEIIKEQMGYLEELIEGSPCKFLFRGGCVNKDDTSKDEAALAGAVEFGAALLAK